MIIEKDMRRLSTSTPPVIGGETSPSCRAAMFILERASIIVFGIDPKTGDTLLSISVFGADAIGLFQTSNDAFRTEMR
jgi:hypothetical protein